MFMMLKTCLEAYNDYDMYCILMTEISNGVTSQRRLKPVSFFSIKTLCNYVVIR